jgi:hypothetical protein
VFEAVASDSHSQLKSDVSADLPLVIKIVDNDASRNIDLRHGEAQVQAAVKAVTPDVQHQRAHHTSALVIAGSTSKQAKKVPESHERKPEGASTGTNRPSCPNS